MAIASVFNREGTLLGAILWQMWEVEILNTRIIEILNSRFSVAK